MISTEIFSNEKTSGFYIFSKVNKYLDKWFWFTVDNSFDFIYSLKILNQTFIIFLNSSFNFI